MDKLNNFDQIQYWIILVPLKQIDKDRDTTKRGFFLLGWFGQIPNFVCFSFFLFYNYQVFF